MKRLKRLLLGSVGVALLLAGTAAVPASAHAQLESTSPAQSSVLLSPTLKCSLESPTPPW
jgi:methionine-rich copper-binding protein CopC